MSSNTNLISERCSGCGVCAALCPRGCIALVASDEGGWKAIRNSSCTDCGICHKVCWSQFTKPLPVNNIVEGEACFAGHAKDKSLRWNGASGGVTTAFLLELFRRRLVGQVACVKNTNSCGMLFEYQLADSEEAIIGCQKSAYYPTEISSVLRRIREGETKTAIVGLPCVCQSIRNAMKGDLKLQRNIFCLVGLVCGQMKSRHYTEYLLERLGISCLPDCISFRKKDAGHHANDFAFHAADSHGSATLFWLEGVAPIYMSGMFKLQACFHCKDVFANRADITFMDAWLPEYSEASEGNNLVISRREDLTGLLETSNSLALSPIRREKVLQSQVGVMEIKQTMAEENLAIKAHSWNPFTRCDAFFLSELAANYKAVAHLSNRQWACGIRGEKFDEQLKELLKMQRNIQGHLSLFRKIRKITCHPFRTILRVTASQIKRHFL